MANTADTKVSSNWIGSPFVLLDFGSDKNSRSENQALKKTLLRRSHLAHTTFLTQSTHLEIKLHYR